MTRYSQIDILGTGQSNALNQLAQDDEVLGFFHHLHGQRRPGTGAFDRVAQDFRRDHPRIGFAMPDRREDVDDRLLLLLRVLAVRAAP